jgi:hypothetical protein
MASAFLWWHPHTRSPRQRRFRAERLPVWVLAVKLGLTVAYSTSRVNRSVIVPANVGTNKEHPL